MADYTGTAELARKRYELAKGRAESNLAQKLGGIGRQYYYRSCRVVAHINII